jgi:hypothetical protein
MALAKNSQPIATAPSVSAAARCSDPNISPNDATMTLANRTVERKCLMCSPMGSPLAGSPVCAPNFDV